MRSTLEKANQVEIVWLLDDGAELPNIHGKALSKGQRNGMIGNQMAVGHEEENKKNGA